jgi:N-acetylmuramoyl-L-alanine amidase
MARVAVIVSLVVRARAAAAPLAAAGLLVAAVPLAGCGKDEEETEPPTTATATAPSPAAELGGPETEVPKRTSTTPPRREETASEEDADDDAPPIKRLLIPFSDKRKRETARYAQRHYGFNRHRLEDPKVMVMHYSGTDTVRAARALFAPDRPDPELRERPNVCVHFIVGKNGRIYQFVPVELMCRHTVGLNYTAIGVDHVGKTDAEVLGNRRQITASLSLSAWLRCRFDVEIKNVIGHNESLSSPYHRERVPELRRQTHDDFGRPAMLRYREALEKYKCP